MRSAAATSNLSKLYDKDQDVCTVKDVEETKIENPHGDQVGQVEEVEVKSSTYAPAAIVAQLKGTTWLKPKEVLKGTLAVVVVAFIASVLIFELDQKVSTAVIGMHGAWNAPGFVQLLAGGLTVLSASMVGYYSLKHPSPGDTIASIFGGQLVSQGGGATRKMRVLRTKMIIWSVVLVISLFLLNLIF